MSERNWTLCISDRRFDAHADEPRSVINLSRSTSISDVYSGCSCKIGILISSPNSLTPRGFIRSFSKGVLDSSSSLISKSKLISSGSGVELCCSFPFGSCFNPGDP